MLKRILVSIALGLPVLIVFRSIFFGNLPTWGDAPHFYPEEIRELVTEPAAWEGRDNSFGGVNTFIFIWPLMFIYGLIGNNEAAIKVLFYIPSIFLSGFGVYFLTKYLRLSKTVQFFSVLIYLLNTYFLLLIDGGQVGIALAYGFFPLTLLFLKKFLDNPSHKSFILGLTSLVLIGIADPRVAAISFIAIFFWQLVEKKFRSLVYLAPLIISWLGISMYWLVPLIGSMGASQNNLGATIKWYNPLFLFSPHWWQNLFGQIARPPVYFVLVPLLIFAGRSYVFIALFAIFAFLSLGLIPFDKIPFGFAFRDSTKFFIPLMLFAGILIGKTADRLESKFRSKVTIVLIYFFVLFLVAPAIQGKMNFVLSGRQASGDFEKIHQNLRDETGFFRTVWFPEKHPLTYEVEGKPAVDGRDLAHFWPFASINASEDVFNFLNNDEYVTWLRVLGVKYLILSDNSRRVIKSVEDKKSWETILDLIDNNKNLTRVDWETTIPIYKIENSYPRFYTVDKLIAVVGPQLNANHYPLIPSLYFEDGKWDPKMLSGKDPGSVKIVFSGKDKLDLAMSFLQKFFLAPSGARINEWAFYSTDQYLKYKYELLIRGIKFADFDYQKGIAFSTLRGEKMTFEFEVPEAGEYILAVRTMVPAKGETGLKWQTSSLKLPNGSYKHEIVNNFGMHILNTVALIPKKEFEEALGLADRYISNFGIAEGDLEETEIKNLEVRKLRTLRYGFENIGKNFWVIYNEGFNEKWKLKRGRDYFESVPVFSMVSGYYIKDDWRDLSIEFKGQENVRSGIYWTGVSILVLAIICLMKSKI